MKYRLEKATVCIVGLGYVGLSLAKAFSKNLKVIGFDAGVEKVNKLLRRQFDSRQSTLGSQPRSAISAVVANLTLTTNPKEIAKADFIIICVPTPVTKSKEPNLCYVKSATKQIKERHE